MECVTDTIMSEYPSGGALASRSVAMVPPAPGRFSTMTDWPSASARRCAYMRVAMSMPPPAAKPTMMRMGLVGYDGAEDVCASATPANNAIEPTAAWISILISPDEMQ